AIAHPSLRGLRRIERRRGRSRPIQLRREPRELGLVPGCLARGHLELPRRQAFGFFGRAPFRCSSGFVDASRFNPCARAVGLGGGLTGDLSPAGKLVLELSHLVAEISDLVSPVEDGFSQAEPYGHVG